MKEKVDLLVKASHMLTKDFEILNNYAVAIKGQFIVGIGPEGQIEQSYTATKVIDGHGKVLMPGLIDGHIHHCQQFLRGAIADELPMTWARVVVPFESNLYPEDVYASSMQCGLELIKAGITSFAEAGGTHMEKVALATEKLGLRGAIARCTMDSGDLVQDSMKETTEDCIKNTEELYKEFNNKGDGRIKIWFALRQAMTSTPKLVETVSAKAKEYDTGVHVHLAEHRKEVEHCLVNYNMRPGEWFDSFGLANNRLLAAHSVLLRDSELKMLVEKGVNFIHCPRANLSAHGIPKAPLIKALGGNIGLGTDGAVIGALDLFYMMRILQLAASVYWGLTIHDPISLVSRELLEMTTINGAKALGLDKEIGTIELNKKADIILIDFEQNHLSPNASVIHTITGYVQTVDVTDVVIDGKLVMENRTVLTCDEKEVLAKAREHQSTVFKRAQI